MIDSRIDNSPVLRAIDVVEGTWPVISATMPGVIAIAVTGLALKLAGVTVAAIAEVTIVVALVELEAIVVVVLVVRGIASTAVTKCMIAYKK